MDSPVDDPYKSLGVSKQATAAEIKTAYRKLVLRCHPDKVTDEALKKKKADEFHRIQQAYEILSDENKKGRYDAQQRLEQLRAEILRKEGGRGPSKVPMCPPFPGNFDDLEVRTPSFSDDYPDVRASAARKHSDSCPYARRPSPTRSKPERERRSDREKYERRRPRDAEVRDSRGSKVYNLQDDIDDRSRFEAERRARDDAVKQREREAAESQKIWAAKVEEANRKEAEARRADDSRRRAATSKYDAGSPKYESQARRYQSSPERVHGSRPGLSRSESSRHYYESSAHRSRAEPRTRRRTPEIVEEREECEERGFSGERGMPRRSYTTDLPANYHEPPPAPMRRAETMPMPSSTSHMHSSTRKYSESGPSSKLRNEVFPDSGYSSSSSPTVSPGPNLVFLPGELPSATFSPDTLRSTYPLEVRYPKSERSSKDRDRDRRRERIGREELPFGVRTIPAHVRELPVRTRSYSYRSSDEEHRRDRERADRRDRDYGLDRDRGRDRRREMEYGELPSDYTRTHRMQPKSYERDEINMGKKFDNDDIMFSRDSYKSRREKDRRKDRYDRPSLLSRSQTLFA